MNEDTSANESLAVVVRDTLPVSQANSSLFGTTEPLAIIKAASTVAGALKDVIKQQGLISNIKGKEYPRCEAWTLLGTMLGIFPVLVWSRKVDDGWEARVEAKMRDGTIVGAAEAECLRSEHNWQNRDDFALRSMAQTRATAKALRMPLGFVMTLSGFEATPAEEMTFETSAPKPTPTHTQPIPPKPEPKPTPKCATDATRVWMIEQLKAGPTGANRQIVTEYFQKSGALFPTEEIEDLPLRFVPVSKDELKSLSNCISNFEAGVDLVKAFDPHDEGEVEKHPKVKNPTVPIEEDDDDIEPPGGWQGAAHRSESPTEPWRLFPMPWGKHAGTPLEELEKNYLFGLWKNYQVETTYNGKPKKPETIAKDQLFREMLDAAGAFYEFNDPDEDE